MPHYKDGKEAKLGDIVKGKLINTAGEIYGVINQITQSTKCNAIVTFKFGGRGIINLNPLTAEGYLEFVKSIHSDFADLDQLELVYRYDS